MSFRERILIIVECADRARFRAQVDLLRKPRAKVGLEFEAMTVFVLNDALNALRLEASRVY